MRTTPEKRKATVSKYNNTPERKQKMREYYLANKEKWKDKDLQKRYGVSLEQYNKMLAEQDNVCYICKDNKSNKALAVDHCHTTGQVRRLLCSNCNTSLGLLKEDIGLMEKLIEYVKETHASCDTK